MYRVLIDQSLGYVDTMTFVQIRNLIQLVNTLNVRLDEVRNLFFASEQALVKGMGRVDKKLFIDIVFVFAENNFGGKGLWEEAEKIFVSQIWNVGYERVHKMLWSLLMMWRSDVFFGKVKVRIFED